MSDTQTRITELFDALPAREQQRLALALYEKALRHEPSMSDLTPDQSAELAEAIAQAERGEVLSSQELKSSMASRFGFQRS